MAVYKRGYKRYDGQVTGRWTRFLAMPRFAWSRLFQQRIVVGFIVGGMIWPLLCATFIYIANHADIWQGLDVEFMNFVKVDGRFFLIFMNVQAMFAVFLAAVAGPGLIAPDLTNNALPLYFSRPLTRTDYVLAKLTVLVGMLSMITWVPGLALFGMQTGMAGWKWFAGNWKLGLAVFAGFMLWIVLVSLVALTSSAYVKWAKVGGALVLGFFFILAGIGEMVNAIFRVKWGGVLNPSRAMQHIWSAMLNTDFSSAATDLDTSACVIALSLMIVFLLLVLERKLRPVEVIT